MSKKDPSPLPSMSAAIEQIAQMLRKETKEHIASLKGKISKVPSVSPVNTIEQIAKLIRTQVAGKAKNKKERKISPSQKQKSPRKK